MPFSGTGIFAQRSEYLVMSPAEKPADTADCGTGTGDKGTSAGTCTTMISHPKPEKVHTAAGSER